MLALDGSCNVASHALGDEVVVGPVAEGVGSDAHAVIVLHLGESHVDGAVGADFAVGVYLIVVGVEAVARLGLGCLGTCVGESLHVGTGFVGHIGGDCGGLGKFDGLRISSGGGVGGSSVEGIVDSRSRFHGKSHLKSFCEAFARSRISLYDGLDRTGFVDTFVSNLALGTAGSFI